MLMSSTAQAKKNKNKKFKGNSILKMLIVRRFLLNKSRQNLIYISIRVLKQTVKLKERRKNRE